MDLDFISFNINEFVVAGIKLFSAFLLALPVAYEREEATRIMGLRTYPIVAMGSCAFFLVGMRIFGADADVQARIMQGLMTGIGFLGSGAILKHSGEESPDVVRGTATAASIWATGALGAAAAYGYYEVGILVSAAIFIMLRLFNPIKEAIDE